MLSLQMGDRGLPRRDVLAAARVAVVDRTTAQVVSALQSAEVRSIVLKGAAFARWLYDDGELRSYGDADLLITTANTQRVGRVLESIGYRLTLTDTDLPPFNRTLHAHTWSRAGSPSIDVHQTLAGATASPAEVWAAVTKHTETMELSGTRVEVLGPAGQAVHVVLHLAAHGAAFPGPVEDLVRALDRLSQTEWESASQLAARIGALESFKAGLYVLPAGRSLASNLGLPRSTSTEVNLRAAGSPRLALHLEWLRQANGVRAKLFLARRLLLPPRAFMEADVAADPRPRVALAKAYVSRLMQLPRHAPAALGAWRRAGRTR